MKLLLMYTLLVGILFGADPLPSWNDGPSKKAITDFVEKVTKDGSADFVKAEDRVAVFDNDGTLWSEQPLYFQAFFAMDRLKAMAPDHPEWKETEPYASLMKGDVKAAAEVGKEKVLKALMDSHGGATQEEFDRIAREWLKTAKHPKTGKLFTEMVFQPMLELLEYLRANGFKTYIVSGGGIEFIRAFAQEVYGIPPEQVVGTVGDLKYEVKDGKPMLVRSGKAVFIDDGPGKPVGIQRFIGKRPIMAFGNSDGDFQMLEWTTSGEGPRFAGIVHHTDEEREWKYDRDSHIGKLDRGLTEGPQRKWTIIDMKTEWSRIYPE
ncbi:Phosphoserine phosphatase [Rubritalea squalenifaciens DSM 18772]|uniref:Phosphoserine phosphatase n=1 Tax=Rubritalea squalenifaciens DSM 18772 TaxID=1123071 RepID=A0A1M6PR74_9BACT|nr:HAD family hydrolase [Rubritalea squalenifaciens]SHK10474.1 Phosphoserine phosphatase [Rubritalea squalenifaciens DSM 18772]